MAKAPSTDIIEEVVEETPEQFQQSMRAVQTEQLADLQQAAKRYPALVTMRSFLKVLGVVFALVYLVVGIILLFTSETFGQGLLYFLLCIGGAFLLLVFCYFLAEFIEVMLQIEHNVRTVAQRTEKK
ncbi:hypothetical protein H6771_00440 [Candidatus Peribacteria bacterium]|nr:hypothetical protein [Candidatus Peribacteria bacterium]